jgi:hypothetical protein
MNKQIDELIGKALDQVVPHTWHHLNRVQMDDVMKKFAELIVRECVERVTSKANGWGDMTGFAIKESILDCAKDLKEHFGVEL